MKMNQQIITKEIKTKNEQEILKSVQYSDVYRKMISQMAKHSEEYL